MHLILGIGRHVGGEGDLGTVSIDMGLVDQLLGQLLLLLRNLPDLPGETARDALSHLLLPYSVRWLAQLLLVDGVLRPRKVSCRVISGCIRGGTMNL